MKIIIISLFSVMLILCNSSLHAEQSIAQQNLLDDWQQFNEIEKQANDMWENSSVKQQLDIEKFQDKEKTKKLVNEISLLNQKILNYIDSFHPTTEEVQQAIDIQKMILITFRYHLIHHIELSSKNLAEDELAKIYFYRIRNLLSVSSNLETEIQYKLKESNP